MQKQKGAAVVTVRRHRHADDAHAPDGRSGGRAVPVEARCREPAALPSRPSTSRRRHPVLASAKVPREACSRRARRGREPRNPLSQFALRFCSRAVLAWWVMGGMFSSGPAVPVIDNLMDTAWAEERALPSCLQCNLVLLNLDLLRADHVGLLNPKSGLTPNIDQFFGNALIFEDVSSGSGATYLSATATATATEAMLNRHDIWNIKPGGGSWRIPWIVEREGDLLVDALPTLAETLRSNGYYTIGINDWIHSGRRVNLDRGFTRYIELPLFGSLFEEQLITVMETLKENTEKPFYLYFHSNSLHFKFHFPPDRAYQDPRFSRNLRQVATRKSGALVFNGRQGGLSEDLIWSAYAEQIRYMDEQLGELFRFIEHHTVTDTIVGLYSNHGTDIDEDGRLGVGLPYRNYLHVPLFIRHPDATLARRVTDTVSLVDLAPTIYDLLGIQPLVELSTHSMTPLLLDGDYPREFVFSKDIQFESIRKGQWKLVIAGGEISALYDLKEDPDEKNDLSETAPGIARGLMSALIAKRIQQVEYERALRRRLQGQKPE